MNFLSILDLTAQDAAGLVLRAREMKEGGFRSELLAGNTVILVFEKASTRTRVSFEVGITHLGGRPLFLSSRDSQLGRSEPLKDTARVLSRYGHCLVVRTFGQDKLEELARYATIPVVNALSDTYHPCQVMSDMLTMFERAGNLPGLTVAWVGDGNNMAHSLMNAAAHFPFSLRLACPEGFEPDPGIVENARALGADVTLTRDPEEAVAGARFVHTDVWASMGQEDEQQAREKAFAGFQVNRRLLAAAAPDCEVLHCLPAHRGEEIDEETFEANADCIFEQAENRLHMQKALLEHLFAGQRFDEAAAERLISR